jgi:hypothetical protein
LLAEDELILRAVFEALRRLTDLGLRPRGFTDAPPALERRLIASPRLWAAVRLQQGFATGEMGFRGQFARQQSWTSHVLVGSKADISPCPRHVRFTPKSGHTLAQLMSTLCHKQTFRHEWADRLTFEFELFDLPYSAPDPRLGHSR